MTARNAIHQTRHAILLLAMGLIATDAIASTLISYTGPSIAIPDNNPAGINAVLSVSGLGAIADLNFTLNHNLNCSTAPGDPDVSISHSRVGDVIVRLTSPQGTTATLINRRGGSLINFCRL